MIDKLPKLMFKNNFIAKQYLWRAIRHVPIVSKNSHVPIPDSKTPVKRVGDQILVLLLPDQSIQFIRLSNTSPQPPKEIRRKPGDLILSFSIATVKENVDISGNRVDDNRNLNIYTLSISTLLTVLQKKYNFVFEPTCTYDIQIHKFCQLRELMLYFHLRHP